MKKISIVIPNLNMADTLGRCLEAAFASDYPDFEVIVVDDCSTDNSVEVINKFPCRLIELKEHAGTSIARNRGAEAGSGDIVFLSDADCMLQKDTLRLAAEAIEKEGKDTVIGGTYTKEPADEDFFSRFQSIFVNYSETKNPSNPDYIASHAMAIDRETLMESGGLPSSLPILEDVEFSHLLKLAGKKLLMNPEIKVKHIFNFTPLRSMKNAFRKSRYWTLYSLRNNDLTSDSGCASTEIKFNVLSFALVLLLLISGAVFKNPLISYLAIPIPAVNAMVSRGLLKAFYNTGGAMFTVISFLYWSLIYPIPVGLGGLAGLLGHIVKK